MNKLKKAIIGTVVALTACSGLILTQPAMAGIAYHHWHHRHHHYYHGHSNFGAGMFFGSALGFMAGALANSDNNDCVRRVVIRRVCRIDRWGWEHCYRVRRLRWFC